MYIYLYNEKVLGTESNGTSVFRQQSIMLYAYGIFLFSKIFSTENWRNRGRLLKWSHTVFTSFNSCKVKRNKSKWYLIWQV